MAGETLELRNIGPIRQADVTFGDLTVLVGPQATGKSILFQFLKLILDAGPVFQTLRDYGLDWDQSVEEFLELYLGEGAGRTWRPSKSSIRWRQKSIDLEQLVCSRKRRRVEQAFLIPAQRVLTLSWDGWLRPFGGYKVGDPFCVRDFSEKLRTMMEAGFGGGEAIHPHPKRLKSGIKDLLSRNIFAGFELIPERHGPQRRFFLRGKGNIRLPFMVWSAGQREFVPLLLGLYWLMPPSATRRRGAIRWVMIEEPEMGLHPRAISATLLIVLDLLWRGYHVCLSTHSPHVLELIWAIRHLARHGQGPDAILRVLDAATTGLRDVAETALKKQYQVYYFDPDTHRARDISELDPASDSDFVASWGGLTDISARAAEAVARAAADADGAR